MTDFHKKAQTISKLTVNTIYKFVCFIALVALCPQLMWGQSSVPAPNATLGAPKRDTSMNKSNTSKWKDEEAKISYEKLNSAKVYYPDTALHTFDRRPFIQPWYKDLGNMGSPVLNLMFAPQETVGPSLGYHIFDVYRYDVDNLNFYNTNRPYSVFAYELGSKLEQTVSIMHSQNVKPNWNFTFEYRKINSPGFYKIQRTNHDNVYLNTNYKSLDKHYTIYSAVSYNKEQHDENGGIVNDSELSSAAYVDRKTVDVAYQNNGYSLTRSPVTNMQRDVSFMFQQCYTWGKNDTTYNTDSTAYTYILKPKFSITHYFQISSQRHEYKDLAPDSVNYISLFNHAFTTNGAGTFVAGEDSMETQQNWFWVENKVMFNGFLGKKLEPLKFSLGAGNRYDMFVSKPVNNLIIDSLPQHLYSIGLDRSSYVSNYVAGDIRKEALHSGAWEYGATGKFFVTGTYAGDLLLNGVIGKELNHDKGSLIIGAGQQLSSAPYNMTNIENRFVKLFYDFNKQSTTSAFFSVDFRKWRLSAGAKMFVMNNYLYINDSLHPAQYNIPFTMTQGWIRKVFKMGKWWYLDNELVYQTYPVNAPVNIPGLMGRHQLSYERSMFKNAIKIVVGMEVRYITTYHEAGYDPLLNQFFYNKQGSSYIDNNPEMSLFFNFRVKHLRFFVMGDQLQQAVFSTNTINFVGAPVHNFYGNLGTNIPVYAAQNTMIRFGFNWVLVN